MNNPLIQSKIQEVLEAHCSEYSFEPSSTVINGYEFIVDPCVFNPKNALSTGIMVEQFPMLRGLQVLDLGCGTGVLGVLALYSGAARVVFTDINPRALENSRRNLRLHAMEDRGEVLESDLFSALPERRFDVILFNIPFLYVEDSAAAERLLPIEFRGKLPPISSFFDPGYRTTERFFQGAKGHLRQNGCIFCTFATVGNEEKLSEILECNGYIKEIVNQHPIEEYAVLLYRVTPS